MFLIKRLPSLKVILKNQTIEKKMTKNILITGGAGFIGQKLIKALLVQGANIRVLDNFSPQVHGPDSWPSEFSGRVELIRADIRDQALLKDALDGMDTIVHLAAETGTGQSMYEIGHYFDVNVQATAALLELLQKSGNGLKSIIVASSRAVYGEGAYQCSTHGLVFPGQRVRDEMLVGDFSPKCPLCRSSVTLLPTMEDAPFRPTSMYGLTKQVQEQLVLLFAQTQGINAFGLRYQNVYGAGQSLKNPYTGILAVFSNLARQDLNIEIYEDGLESRDFICVDDVVEATLSAINYEGKFIGALNVGSGVATTVRTVAEEVCKFFDSKSSIKQTGNFRIGDIRHNIADITKIRNVLNFSPKVSFSQGLGNFLSWASAQPEEDSGAYARSVVELSEKGLMGRVGGL